MLTSKSISYTYDGVNEFNFPDIRLKNGESLLVLGDSGIGKTTFVHILAGLLKSKSGIVNLNNTNYNTLSSKEMDQFRGQNIGMIFQQPYFIQNLSILDNLMLSLYLSKNQLDRKSSIQLLNDIGLGNKLSSKPNELSQGEKQRAAIALAVIKKPGLILADEPTSSLDDSNCQTIITLLKNQAVLSKAKLIIITHDNRLKTEFNKSISL